MDTWRYPSPGRAAENEIPAGRPRLVAAAACFATVALLFAIRGPAYDVQGNASVPYHAGTVKEVRVLDSITVYVDGEPKPGPSVIGGIALIVLATAAFMTAAALRFAHRRGRLIAFYLLISAGLGYAGLDELFAIHETSATISSSWPTSPVCHGPTTS